ncbi:alpha/beta fold hydrolase [Streptomyces viridosporus]|uniref:alpha/beta fold hydrolase n=1 Tax=Streptomyces viridosporus TaxID=67581 RepID=UPI003F65E686
MIGARRFLGAVVVWSERVVVRDGVRLVCRDRGGPGKPVVLLHGLAGHAGEWEVVASRLIARYRVVTVDQRGHGASERHPQAVSRAAYVADVVATVEQLGRYWSASRWAGTQPCSPPSPVPHSSAGWCSSRRPRRSRPACPTSPRSCTPRTRSCTRARFGRTGCAGSTSRATGAVSWTSSPRGSLLTARSWRRRSSGLFEPFRV